MSLREEEFVILVDEQDNEQGTMEKMQAHYEGKLHRAFSVFLFNEKKELLLQRRALTKYHSPGLWTNTCCSHPRKGEETVNAAIRRMKEEMGIEADVEKAYQFLYHSDVGQGLIEHELDHVFVGEFSGNPVINEEEVSEWKYASLTAIEEGMSSSPEEYTVWFRITFDSIREYMSTK